MLTPLSQESKQLLAQAQMAESARALVTTEPDKTPIGREMLSAHGADDSAVSLILMPVLPDEQMPAGQTLGVLVLATDQRGAYTEEHAELLTTLIAPFGVATANALKHRELSRLKEILADDNRSLHREMQSQVGDEIVGADFGLREVSHKVRQVASTESPVLLTGETGVGKDVIANAIHLGSPRRDGPFIPVNCGAIPDSLMDSELFGHEKGAFTGALSRKRGRFERAHGGTILLDEIGEMPLPAQVRLLRVLQHREIERVGGTERIPVDIRIVAATNKDLPTMARAGRFREDLWFRLNVFPITVPPLRERTGDIPALVHHFIERKAKELKIADRPRLAPGAIDDLLAYPWPGNVRELENLVERAMILHRGEPLRFDDLGAPPPEQTAMASAAGEDENLVLDEVIARHIKRVLGMTGGKIHGPGGAGELLGVNPNTLRNKMKKLGIAFRRQPRLQR
jgi:transcriptional regulator with GAF, ATPase, and Fis domain